MAVAEVATPGLTSIEEVSAFLGIKATQTLKSVFYSADGEIVFIVIRGDYAVNEIKLKNLLKCTDLHMATEAEVKYAGLVAGYASAIDIKGIKVIADDSITRGSNFVAGANKPDMHLRNVNYPRDFKVDVLADIATVKSGDSCPRCNGQLQSQRGIEVGHVFKLGTFLSERIGAHFLDKDGVTKPIIMGCYGIGLGRLLAAAVEQNHDDKGITWPLPIAPFQVHLCPLRMEDQDVVKTSESIYFNLQQAGVEVLMDDRDESPGIKFNDADLLGIPLRIVISPKTLKENNVEIKWRREKQAQLIALDGLTDAVRQLLNISGTCSKQPGT
jgi:prolyl-tRNA synthetase